MFPEKKVPAAQEQVRLLRHIRTARSQAFSFNFTEYFQSEFKSLILRVELGNFDRSCSR